MKPMSSEKAHHITKVWCGFVFLEVLYEHIQVIIWDFRELSIHTV
jgi:hypothetical protein